MPQQPDSHTDERAGGCLCGQVRYRLWGEPINVRVCHCDLCRKALGGPYFARALVPRDQLEITGETARYASSPRLTRVFCPNCGTTLFGERTADPITAVGIATLDDPNAFIPECHMFVDFKLDFVTLDPATPQYPRWAP